MKHVFALVAAFGLLLCLPAAALAWPNGPADDPRDDPPNDPGFGGQWEWWSHVPESWAAYPGFRQEEVALGTGMHVDRAWQVTTGDRRVIIAILDSGAYWTNSDLVAKYYLNRGELAGCKPEALDTPPAGADAFDVDGSGWFDIRDYLARWWPAGGGHQGSDHGAADDAFLAAHPDWDANGNGMFEPQDLIQRCSDGVDDDGNGYVDDISGWDFFADDNDAYDDNQFGHGNSEARDSCSEGDNGIGDIGICPGCTALMVRAADSFVADANEFAQGVAFAVDSGASVIQEALGSLNNTAFTRAAIDYAYANNVTVIASAADELSYHHNFPGTNNHTVYVHAIMHDGASPDQSTTFLNFNNCTNFGMQLLLSTPGKGCSSEATALTAGQAGLVYSAGLQAGLDPPLSAEEVKQLLIANVDDIDVNPLDDDPTKYYSGPGWDWHFGYGRNNARKSVDAVMAGHIPPEVDILEPSWFQVLYPDVTPTIDITGRIGQRTDGRAARYAEVTWRLEFAPGVQVNDGDFTEIASGTSAGLSGVLGTWDLTEVPMDLDAPNESAHQKAVTLRLWAEATAKDGSKVRGEMRKGFLLERDPDLLAGFPIELGASGESSPTFADLDGDEIEELVAVTTDGLVHAYQADATEAEGFPALIGLRHAVDPARPGNLRGACAFREDKTGCVAGQLVLDPDVRQTVMMAPAVGDLDGNGTLEIIVSTWDGWVFAFDSDGSPRPGWPRSVDWELAKPDKHHIVESGFFAAPVLYDLDGQPGLEVLVAAMDQHLYAWHHDGTPMAPYPVWVGSETDRGDRIICTPAVGDADGDGDPDIAVGTSEVFGAGGTYNESIAYVLDARTGALLEGWPQSLFGLTVNLLPIVGRGVVTNPLMADLDYDGDLEISFDTLTTQGWMFQHDGTIYGKMDNQTFGAGSDSQDSPAFILMNNGAFGDMDGERGIDFVKGTAGFDFAIAFAGGGERGYFDHHLSGWDTETGKMLAGFPRIMDDWQFFNTPAIVDIDGDNDAEAIIGSAGYLVHAFNYLGHEPAGWPKQTGGWIIASAAVGEMDGDGLFEVAITTRDGWLYAWNTPGKVQGLYEWGGFGHDPHNTNNYEMDPIPYRPWTGGPVEPDPEPAPELAPESPPDAPAEEADAGAVTDTGATAEDTATEPGKKSKGCAGAGAGGGAAWLVLAMLAMLATRRRLA